MIMATMIKDDHDGDHDDDDDDHHDGDHDDDDDDDDHDHDGDHDDDDDDDDDMDTTPFTGQEKLHHRDLTLGWVTWKNHEKSMLTMPGLVLAPHPHLPTVLLRPKVFDWQD